MIIAPLVAIPVLSIVGVPQFPLAASATTEQGENDFGTEPPVELAEAAAFRPAPAASRATADDLYAPIDSGNPRDADGLEGGLRTERPKPVDWATGDDAGRVPGRPARAIANAPTAGNPVPPAEGVGDWDLDAMPRSRRRSAVREVALSDGDSLSLEESPEAERGTAGLDARTERSQPVVGGDDGSAAVELPPESDAEVAPQRPRRTIPDEQQQVAAELESQFTRGLVHPVSGVRSASSAGPVRNAVRTTVPNRSLDEERMGIEEAAMEMEEAVPLELDPSIEFEGEPEPQLTWPQAVARLKQLGIRRYKLHPSATEGRFVFVCQVPQPANPRITRRFEAEGASPLMAVGAVLTEVAEWQRSR